VARRLDLDQLEAGIRAADRAALARGITLVESARPGDLDLAQELIERLLPATGQARRVGISGPPGVGKSSFIEALGKRLVAAGHRLAVLAIDPSSTVSGGSILGDKARMTDLAREEAAFIRPSPSATSLGGVARRTREASLLCEAAGYDTILIETVGVGQSEVAVADMVDSFCVLAQPASGDELQGIKRGILELADLVVVHKADGDLLSRARITAQEMISAFRYARPRPGGWRPRALLVSSLKGEGFEDFLRALDEHRAGLMTDGSLDELRREQRRRWLWTEIRELLAERFSADPVLRERLAEAEEAVSAGTRSVTAAARALLA
jgi:GTPase